MAVPQVVKKNYIAVVSDTTEEQRALDSLEGSNPRVTEFLLGLMAGLLRRRRSRLA